MSEQSFRDKINIDQQYHEAYLRFASRNAGDKRPFQTMKDMFLAAAMLGWRYQNKKPLNNRKSIFAWAQINSRQDVAVLQAIAIAYMKTPQVLVHRDEVLSIVEEFANGGIESLLVILERPGGVVHSLIEEILDM